jgi:antitoxin component YwqK of YwqJK toxin-antitoxin module
MSFLNEELIGFTKECIYYPDETKYIEYSKLDNEYHSIDNNTPSYVLYNINGDPDIIKYYNKGKLHRDSDNPSEFRLYNNIVIYQGWYKNGLKHRDNGPAEIYSDNNGKIQIEIWYKNGLKHRDNGPAEYHLKFINDKYQYKEMIYYKEGKIHSDVCYSYIKYYENGNIKYKKWYTNDILSCEEYPSVIGYYKNKKLRYEIWYKDGNKHHSQYNYQPSEIYYYENGNIMSKGSFKDDKPEGMWEDYYPNGNLECKGLYKDGKMNGYWDYYYPDAGIGNRRLYDNGDLII